MTVGQMMARLRAYDPDLPLAIAGPDPDRGPSWGAVHDVRLARGGPTFDGYERPENVRPFTLLDVIVLIR